MSTPPDIVDDVAAWERELAQVFAPRTNDDRSIDARPGGGTLKIAELVARATGKASADEADVPAFLLRAAEHYEASFKDALEAREARALVRGACAWLYVPDLLAPEHRTDYIKFMRSNQKATAKNGRKQAWIPEEELKYYDLPMRQAWAYSHYMGNKGRSGSTAYSYKPGSRMRALFREALLDAVSRYLQDGQPRPLELGEAFTGDRPPSGRVEGWMNVLFDWVHRVGEWSRAEKKQSYIRRRARRVLMLSIPGGFGERMAWRFRWLWRTFTRSWGEQFRRYPKLTSFVLIAIVAVLVAYPFIWDMMWERGRSDLELTANETDPASIGTGEPWSASPGPPRDLYWVDDVLPTSPAFNSSFARTYGSSWDFVMIRTSADFESRDAWANEISAVPGEIYRVRVYIQNTAVVGEVEDRNTWIDEPRLQLGMLVGDGQAAGYSYQVFARLSATNAETVWDGATFTAARGVQLAIDRDSIRLVTAADAEGTPLGNDVFMTGGVEVDGGRYPSKLPPGVADAIYVTFDVVAREY